MRVLLVLAIAVSVLLAFGVACGGDGEKAWVTPSPASESEGEAGEAEEGEAEEVEETPVDAEEAGGGEVDEGEGPEVFADPDGDGVPDFEIDLCPDTAAGSVVDDVGCSDAQADQDNDGICDPAVPSDGPGDCNPIDDNCPESPNPAQEDFDGDLAGDACDRDDDDDGFTDADETDYGSHPYDDASVPETEDVNPDSCIDDVDNDGDGLTDGVDPGCP